MSASSILAGGTCSSRLVLPLFEWFLGVGLVCGPFWRVLSGYGYVSEWRTYMLAVSHRADGQ